MSVPVETCWFRHAGGMPPISLAEHTDRYLSFEEHEEIALLRVQQVGVRRIRTRRNPGKIPRELRLHTAIRGGNLAYRTLVAQWKVPS